MSNIEDSIVVFNAQISTKDISREAASFLMFALLKDVLIQIPHYEQSVTTEYDEIISKQ
jgi:hypothetical protein